MAAPDRGQLEQFVLTSALLTGYDQTELWGTGMAEPYFEKVQAEVHEEQLTRLLHLGVGAPGALNDMWLLPIAQNVIKLWYLGVWADETFPMSPNAFVQGLAWEAMGGHPQGAKQQGFGSWGEPPVDADFGGVGMPPSDSQET